MSGASSEQPFWTEQPPEAVGCFARGAGFAGGIWAWATDATSAKAALMIKDWNILRDGTDSSDSFDGLLRPADYSV